jgi:hypothetical protein
VVRWNGMGCVMVCSGPGGDGGHAAWVVGFRNRCDDDDDDDLSLGLAGIAGTGWPFGEATWWVKKSAHVFGYLLTLHSTTCLDAASSSRVYPSSLSDR